MDTINCMASDRGVQARIRFHKRKLDVLKVIRDSMERRLSSLNASIETLESQIRRDQQNDPE